MNTCMRPGKDKGETVLTADHCLLVKINKTNNTIEGKGRGGGGRRELELVHKIGSVHSSKCHQKVLPKEFKQGVRGDLAYKTTRYHFNIQP